MTPREHLAALEEDWAEADDRSVAEYRDYWPEHVVVIDVLRAVLDDLDRLTGPGSAPTAVVVIRATIQKGLDEWTP